MLSGDKEISHKLRICSPVLKPVVDPRCHEPVVRWSGGQVNDTLLRRSA